ncbi:LacI family DNA-binding transcriptional regulator [Lacticaseibacillus suibinensis]|uniref:LacI family DNA-binding transcriptional regulator n=1 Tax=Lacticaseibacillus suibinensis TaxID=2486011 RepID=UPI001940D604|nr:LacI family DNA-binding transcriptional regulator [Lacticaseibacillus suibinensis]
MAVTIRDVAREAEVSVATVSRVINNKGYLSPEAISKVKEAMRRLNYQPNTAARSLQGKPSNTIGVILPSLDNPLYSELFERLEDELSTRHFQTLLCTSKNNSTKEEEYFKLLKSNQVDGIITGSHSDFMIAHGNANYPIVSFDRQISKEIPTVKSDNLAGGKAIAKKIIAQGAKNVLILSGSKEDFYPINDRVTGMLSIFNQSGTEVTTSSLEFESSLALKKMLVGQLIVSREYDAICCTDDVTAILVKTCADAMDYRPVITGYDGSTFVRTFFPTLLTVQQPLKEMAELMVELVIERIKSPKTKLKSNYTFPVKTSRVQRNA